jgi:hypothetical protein
MTSRELVRCVVSGRSGSPSIHSQPIACSCWQKGFSTSSYSQAITLMKQSPPQWSLEGAFDRSANQKISRPGLP